MTIYADTSFFVSLYVKDTHSITADRMLGGGVRPPITPLHIAEWTHAIAQQIFNWDFVTDLRGADPESAPEVLPDSVAQVAQLRD